jgi:hypothetical protein
MKMRTITAVTAALIAWGSLPALAQEKNPTKERDVLPEQLPPAKEVMPIPAPVEDCHAPSPTIGGLWFEQQVPVQVLVPRTVVTTERRCAVKIGYHIEKQKVVNIVMKRRLVPHEVPCTTLVPCTETDPYTGHTTTVMKPVVEMKVQNEDEFYAVPEVQEVEVKVPHLVRYEEEVPRKTIVLEYVTEMQKRGYAIPAPVTEHRPPQWLITPHVCGEIQVPAAGPVTEVPQERREGRSEKSQEGPEYP